MIRKLIILAAAGLLMPVAAASAEPELRAEIVVKGPLVTLGDLFENAGAAAGEAVFRAPDIGAEGTVAALRVQAAARNHGIAWHNAEGIDQVSVKRPSRHVGIGEVAALLAAGAAAKLGAQDAGAIEVKLSGNAKGADFDPAMTEPLEIRQFELSQSGTFRAVLGLKERSDAPEFSYSGQAFETVQVATPARAIGRGEIMLAGDVTIARLPKGRSVDGLAKRREELIGMAAKVALAAGKPVRDSDLMRPRMVEQNAIVTIVYQTPGLIVRAQGKTLGDGALGEAVNVMNTQSKRVLQATVTAPGVVSVVPDHRLAAPGPQASASSFTLR